MKPSPLSASLFAAVLLASAPACAAPCAGFADVDDASPFCPSVEWLRNRSITLGCSSPATYCPDEAVSRLAMAAFMNRLGVALTPTVQFAEAPTGPVDLDALGGVNVCPLPVIAPVPYPRHAIVQGSVSGQFGAAGAGQIRLKYNTDGSDTYPSFVALYNARAGATAAGWGSGSGLGSLALAANTTYRFAVNLNRSSGSGTGDLVDGYCFHVVTIRNANGPSSPFDATAPERSKR